MAFQTVDDILGIWGNPMSTGKPVGADIRARKKSLPVAYALSRAESGALTDFYGASGELAASGEPTAQDVERVTAMLDDLGARTWAEERAQHHLQAAVASLSRAGIDAESETRLLALARMVTTRTS